MGKRFLVLGAGFPQAKLIEAAKKLGYYTIVASIPGNYPGFNVADEVVYADISKKEEVLDAAIKVKADGVGTCCLDTGIAALGYVCDKLHFVGLTERSADCCNDKYKMKKVFADYGVNTAKFLSIKNHEELTKAIDTIGYPCVFKALDLQGSKGVYICRDWKELEEAFCGAKKESKRDTFIIEEYISGNELGAQAFVYHGEILFILPHGDYTYMNKTAIPVGHYVPLEANALKQEKIKTECEKAIRAIGLDNCAVNIDLIERDGEIYLIELTGRAGATCLPELVGLYYGLDYYKMVAMTAMGEDPRPFFNNADHNLVANASHMLISEKTGIVTGIRGIEELQNDPMICDLSLIIGVGDHVTRFASAKDRIGQVIVKGDDYPSCAEKINEVLKHIRVEVKED